MEILGDISVPPIKVLGVSKISNYEDKDNWIIKLFGSFFI